MTQGDRGRTASPRWQRCAKDQPAPTVMGSPAGYAAATATAAHGRRMQA